MNQVDLIKDIEEKYDIKNISSNDLPIWQYIRNLLCNQKTQSNHQASFNTILIAAVEQSFFFFF